MDYDEFHRLLAELTFKLAELFFKYLTWLVLIAGLHYAYATSQSKALLGLICFAQLIYMSSLMAQLFYLPIRDPSTFGIPPNWHRVSRVVQFVLSLAVGIVLTSPALFIDQIIDLLVASRR
jgi:hypothetical protein